MGRGHLLKNIKCSTGEVAANYTAYLRTNHWKAFKNKIIEDRKRECERCFDPVPVPHIHHRTYKRIGKEWDSDVLLLCEKCHAVIHSKRKKETENRKRIIEKQVAGTKLSDLCKDIMNLLMKLEEEDIKMLKSYAEKLYRER